MKAWLDKRNGLPTFYSPFAESITSEDGRILSTGKRQPTLVSDAFAPPGVPITYTVGSQSFRLTREGTGHRIISTADGSQVEVTWVGEDAVSAELGVTMGRARRWSISEPLEVGTLKLRTVGAANTRRLSRILKSRAPFIAVHSPTHCTVPGCDIAPTRILIAMDYENERTGRMDTPVREWSISFEPYQSEVGGGAVPSLTWRDWQKLSKVWESATIESLLQRIAGMP